MRPYLRPFGKMIGSIFTNSQRHYITQAKIPTAVVEAVDKQVQEITSKGKLKDNIDYEVYRRAGEAIFNYAKEMSQQGCVDSESFAKAAEEVRDRKADGIFLSKMSENKDGRNFFIKAITAFFGYRIYQKDYENSIHDYDAAGNVKELQAHTDYEVDHHGQLTSIPFLSLYAIQSPGGPKTYVVELKDILPNLSEKSKEILSQSSFYYYDFVKSRKIGILDIDENGADKINYGFSITYDYKNITPQQQTEIEQALKELRAVIAEAPRQEFELRTGDFLAFNNHTNVHGRTFDKIAGETRNIEIETFYDAKQVSELPGRDVDITNVECLVGDKVKGR